MKCVRLGAAALLWTFVLALCAAGADKSMQGIYQIRSALDENYVLDSKYCAAQEQSLGTLQLYHPLEVKQQEFYFEQVSGRTCRIVNLETGKYLEEGEVNGLSDGNVTSQTTGRILFSERSEEIKDSQVWTLEENDDGTHRIRSASGLYLETGTVRAFNGEEVILAAPSMSSRQRWNLEPAPVYAAGSADTDALNPYSEDGRLGNTAVEIRFQDTQEELGAETLAQWNVPSDDESGEAHGFTFDDERLRTYVESLAQKYNTVGKSRVFVTSYKVPITLVKGNFGWKLNEDATFNLLKEAVQEPGRKAVEPVWSQRGGDFYGTNTDIGSSYVEIDLNAQKVWLYKDGEQLLETDCVSGTKGTDRETPGGVYSIYYKQAPAVLNGPGYSSPVNFWMPFNGNIGLHDAPWRSKFGGEIYKTDGSHGCINLPYEAAELIYKTVDLGYPVVCYH